MNSCSPTSSNRRVSRATSPEAEPIVEADRPLVPGRDEEAIRAGVPVARGVYELRPQERLAEPLAGEIRPEPDPYFNYVGVPVEVPEGLEGFVLAEDGAEVPGAGGIAHG